MTTKQELKKGYRQISGLFKSYSDFHELAEALQTRGYGRNDLSVLMSNNTHDLYFAAKENNKAPEGVTLGGITGGLLGALIGGFTLIGNIISPGIGLVAAGPIVGILTGGAVGAGAGGVIGALIGAGIPEHEARFFEDALKEEGKILLVAHVPQNEAKEIKAVFERYNAEQVKIYS